MNTTYKCEYYYNIQASQYLKMDNTFQNNYNNLAALTSISRIEVYHENQYDESIVNQIGLLDTTQHQQDVRKIQSFLYCRQDKSQRSIYQNHIKKRSYPEQEQLFDSSPINMLKNSKKFVSNPSKIYQKKVANGQQQKLKSKKQVQEQMIYENMLMQRRFNSNKFNSPYHHQNNINPPFIKKQTIGLKSTKSHEQIPRVKGLQKQTNLSVNSQLQAIQMKIEEDYNKSRIMKLYNFILKELPQCQICYQLCTNIQKTEANITLKCTKCHSSNAHHFPFIAILYDLENKPKYQEQLSAFQSIFTKLDQKLHSFQRQIKKIQDLKQKFNTIKNLGRKKYRQINQSRNLVRKYCQNITLDNIESILKSMPKQYLDMMQKWWQINQQNQKQIQGIVQVYKIMPVYLFNNENKFINNLQKILAYEKQQGIRISVSQHIRFPIKKLDEAIFIVDGTYNLPIFENVKHLQLQFVNKKTMRQLNLLFDNFPREIYSLSFNYNHKLHSHISAENYPILKSVLSIQSIQKISIKLENLKDFQDILLLTSALTSKIQFKLIITRHMYSKNDLNLPGTFFKELFDKIGKNLVKFQLHIPESRTSSAIISYQDLLKLDKLCIFKLNRGQRQQKRSKNLKVLQELQQDYQKQINNRLIFKKTLANRIRLIKMIKRINSSKEQTINIAQHILNSLP